MYGNYVYISPAASEVEEELGDTPNPGKGTQSLCTPC